MIKRKFMFTVENINKSIFTFGIITLFLMISLASSLDLVLRPVFGFSFNFC